MKHGFIASATAALLAVASFGAPAAAETVTEDFEVAAYIDVVGVPASVTYNGGAAIVPGEVTLLEKIVPHVTSNGPVSVTFSGGDFSGPTTLDQDTRELWLGIGYAGMQRNPAAYDGHFATSFVENNWNPVYSSTGPVVDGSFDFYMRVNIPVTALAGSYSGNAALVFATS